MDGDDVVVHDGPPALVVMPDQLAVEPHFDRVVAADAELDVHVAVGVKVVKQVHGHPVLGREVVEQVHVALCGAGYHVPLHRACQAGVLGLQINGLLRGIDLVVSGVAGVVKGSNRIPGGDQAEIGSGSAWRFSRQTPRGFPDSCCGPR